MSDAPSFYSLFRRSRYTRDDDSDATGSSRQHRKELYAVAAVAFTLKHDERFRRHFLEAICGISQPSSGSQSIAVQSSNHSDLAIKDDAGRWLVVVEFKVEAKLEKKQNPVMSEFFDKDGYGTLILSERSYQNFVRKIYVVLTDSGYFDSGALNGLEYKSRNWTELNTCTGVETGMWADLLQSLGELGVSPFQLRKFKNMNNASHTTQAVAMHRTLLDIASKLTFGISGGMEINMEGDEAWYGRNIPLERLMKHIRLNAYAGKTASGWFGYQSGRHHRELAFWIYCASPEAASLARPYMQELLKNGPSGKLELAGKDISYVSEEHSPVGDAEWFEGVFRALEDKKLQAEK